MKKTNSKLSRCLAFLLALCMALQFMPVTLAADAPETLENVALHKYVEASSATANTDYWSPAYLTDGEHHDLSGGNHVGWSSADPNTVDQYEEITLTIRLDGKYDISRIHVLPTVFDAGKFFPVAYTLSVSQDGESWTEVASERQEDVPAVEPFVYDFDTVMASYVRMTITENRAEKNADGTVKKYMSQLSEIEVYGKESLGSNVALHKEVTASNYEPLATEYWHPAYLTDGENHDLSGGNHVGWSSKDLGGTSQYEEITLMIDLAGKYDIRQINLLPTAFDAGKYFPVAYTLAVSEDGETWTDVASDRKEEVPAVEPQAYAFDVTTASYVRLTITESRAGLRADGSVEKYMSQLGEIEVYGFSAEDTEPQRDNVALKQKVTASNYFIDSDKKYNYAEEHLTDGLRGYAWEGTYWGWSTTSDIGETTPVTIQLTLEGVYAVDSVELVPIQREKGQYFPVDYTVSLSEDGKTWTKIADVTDAEANAEIRKHATEEAVAARYVKIDITKHRSSGGIFTSRIAEIEVYGDVIARDLPKANKSALRMVPGDWDQLKAGWRSGEEVKDVAWTSDNEDVVTVDENGAVKAISMGTAVITGVSEYGSFTCDVLVDDYVPVENFMITAFWPMQRYNISEEYMDRLAEAGFTNIQNNFSLNIANYDDNMTIARMAYERGMGVTVSEKYWGWGDIAGFTDEQIREEALKYSHVPGVIGYYVIDEPSNASVFANCFAPFKAVMPTADVHLNFVPNVGNYRGLLDLVGTDLDYLSWDAYIFPNQGVMEDRLFTTSETARQLGLEYGVKTAQFVQSCGFNNAYRKPNGNELRYNFNACLAYGNKQVNYFTYRIPEGSVETFTDAIVTADGQKTEIFDDVAEINHAALQLGPTLMSVEALAVYHTGQVTGGYNALPGDYYLQPVSSSDRGLIVSGMKNLDTKQCYTMLVNRDYEKNATVTFTVNEAVKSVQYVSDKTGELVDMTVEDGAYTVELLPGGCILLKMDDGFEWAPDYGVYQESPEGENIVENAFTKVKVSSGKNVGQLTDGARISNTYTDGCGLPGYTASVNGGVDINISFGGEQTVNRIDLYPGDAGKFPTDFVLEGTVDGKTWTTIVEESGYALPENTAYSKTFAEGKYTALRLRVIATASGDLQLCEIELYHDGGSVPAPKPLNGGVAVDKTRKPQDNLARADGVKVICKDSNESAPYWHSWHINDGVGYDGIGAGNAGYCSGVGNNSRATAGAWIGYDLGGVKQINEVVVFNAWHDRGAKKAECYPSDYSIEVSMDGVNWTEAYAVYNDSNWEEVGARVLGFAPVNARYVRFNATRLGRCGDGFMLQLGELEVYGQDVPEEKSLDVVAGLTGETIAKLTAEELEGVALSELASKLDCLTRTVDGVTYTFAGWFTAPQAENDFSRETWAANVASQDDLAVENTIYAYYVNADYLNTTIAYTSNDKKATRVYALSTVPGDIFETYGFALSTAEGANNENLFVGETLGGLKVKDVAKTTVYSYISVAPFTTKATANAFNGNLGGANAGDGYLTYAAISNMPIGKTVSARAYYVTLDGTMVYGTTAQTALIANNANTGLN